MKRQAVIFCLLFQLLCVVVCAQDAPFTPASCLPPPDPNRQDFILDAATGTSLGSKGYDLSDQVRIVVLNKNPLVSEYKLTLQEVEVAEPALAVVPILFPFSGSILSPPSAGTTGTSGAQDTPASCDPLLEGLQPIARQIQAEHEQIPTAETSLRNNFQQLGSRYENLRKALTAFLDDMKKEKIRCEVLAAAIQGFVTSIREFEKDPGLGDLRKQIEGLGKRLNEQEARISAYDGAIPNECKPAVQPDLQDWGNQVKVSKGAVKEVEGKVKEIEDGLKVLTEQRKKVELAASRSQAFSEVRSIGPYEVPTNVTVKLERRLLDPKDQPFTTVISETLNFGGSARFAVSAGIAFSQLQDRSFQRVLGFARPSPGAEPDTSGDPENVIAVKEDSDWRATPLVMIHARMAEWKSNKLKISNTLHLSFGLSAKVENGDTNAEYLAGLSLGFAEQRLFLTFGGYYGGVQELEGGLFEGAAVPASLTEIPVRTERQWKPGFALTYRIR